jgi:hypothetical protein
MPQRCLSPVAGKTIIANFRLLALAAVAARSKAIFERAEAFAAALARDLDRCAAIHTVMARELAAAYDIRPCRPKAVLIWRSSGRSFLLAWST